MASKLVLLIGFVSLCTTTQAFFFSCKDGQGQEITPLEHVDDAGVCDYQFVTPGYPDMWYKGVHCNWHTEPLTPDYTATCRVDFDNELVMPCDHECPNRLEVHYIDQHGLAKDVYCSTATFTLEGVRLLDLFISPESGGAVQCDINKIG